jgi:inactivated superfamily I helicase
MARHVKAAERLASLQRRVAEQKRLEWMRSQQVLTELSDRSHSLVKTLDGAGLAWQLFPDLSTRHLGKLMSETSAAKESANRAALISMQESKRLEVLEWRSALLQRGEEQRMDDEQRLENAARGPRSSLPQA